MKKHKMNLIRGFVVLLNIALIAATSAAIYTVTLTGDEGPGSLRQAIIDANDHAGPDTVCFNILTSNSGFDGTVWRISPSTYLPSLTDDSTSVLGTTQTDAVGDMNPDGPEMVLDGRDIQDQTSGISIQSSGNVISGLVISGFHGRGISIAGSSATNNRILGNYIGTDPAGTDTVKIGGGIGIEYGANNNWIGGSEPLQRNLISGNKNPGIYIFQSDSNVIVGNIIGLDRTGTQTLGNDASGIFISNSRGNRVGGGRTEERNIISGNSMAGIYMSGDKSTRDNSAQGNFIGTDISGKIALGNVSDGIAIGNGASANLIGGTLPGEFNLISGHAGSGIYIYTSATDSNQVIGNLIGTDIGSNSPLPNAGGGVVVYNGPKSNQIGPSNTIRYNFDGVQIQFDVTLYNRITQNSISDNTRSGIILFNDGNGGLTPPSLLESASGVEGIAIPNSTVEIFSDSSNQGWIFEGTVTADPNGNFSWTGTPAGPFVTATATDQSGNTSEFSQPLQMTVVEKVKKEIPERFSLSQNYPNPFNSSTMIRFDVRSSCRVELKVYDATGKEVAVLADGSYGAGSHVIHFDASVLPSGIYVVMIKAGSLTAARKLVVVE